MGLHNDIKHIPTPNFPIFTPQFIDLCEEVTNKVGVEGFVDYMHEHYPEHDDNVKKIIQIYLGTN